MTEKRFTINETWGKSLNRLIGVICDNNNDMYITDVVALLNNLSEENEQLKSEIEKLSYANEDLLEEKRIWKQMSDEYTKLSDENEQLKQNLRMVEKRADKVYEENEQLKQSYIQLKHRHSLLHDECLDAECDRDGYHKDVLSLEKENEELKKELVEFKKWEKHIRDVRREDLDRVFKMSVYEIAEAFEYYKERIKKLERSCK